MQQPMSEEIHSLLSTESIKVACSSVLKEMAVDCDLTDLEEVILLGKSVLFCDPEEPEIQLILKINTTMKWVKFVLCALQNICWKPTVFYI